MITVNEQAAIAALELINGLIQVGTANPNARLAIFQGTRPATPTAHSAILLAQFTLPTTLFGPSAIENAEANAYAVLASIPEANILSTGEAQWFRIFNRNDQAVMDGSVTDGSGNGDLKLQQTTLLAGRKVKIVSWITRYPQ